MPPRRHIARVIPSASLFGQKNSNRDYTKEDDWGKNIFNSSFPASLVAYMASIGIDPVYLVVNDQNEVQHSTISPSTLFGIDPLSENAYYSFETEFPIYKNYYTAEKKEHIDLVMKDLSSGLSLTGLEIKLTAIPDNSTKDLSEDRFSSELVIRRPTICYLACSICDYYEHINNGRARLNSIVGRVTHIEHWDSKAEVAPHYTEIEDAVLSVSLDAADGQKPLIVQPIWKSLDFRSFSEDCLDVFVWSNLSIIKLMSGRADPDSNKINRFQTAFIWLFRMLADYASHGCFNYDIITSLNYGQRNDKAFSVNGSSTFKYLQCEELFHPRIKRSEIKNIVLGGGQDLLMPERRFDAFIVTNPDVFE